MIELLVTKEVQVEIERAQKDFMEVIDAHELRVQAYQGHGKGIDKTIQMLSGCIRPDEHATSLLKDVRQEQAYVYVSRHADFNKVVERLAVQYPTIL